jgi:hypothetical protein
LLRERASAAERLETWMRVTAQGAIQTILRSGVMTDEAFYSVLEAEAV